MRKKYYSYLLKDTSSENNKYTTSQYI